ncbi:MAG TPA: hypothetical protein VN370_13435 [Desulfitobacteriaceae bacterium]|nr:hypothetical protein [Desulfitobacteriaceae bacterium]
MVRKNNPNSALKKALINSDPVAKILANGRKEAVKKASKPRRGGKNYLDKKW